MENNEYLKWAVTKDRTDAQYVDLGYRLEGSITQKKMLHAILGIAGETGELTDIVKKSILYNKILDVEHAKEELGDILWYMSILMDTLGTSFEEVMQMNYDKLEKRFPTGFTEEAAKARADKV